MAENDTEKNKGNSLDRNENITTRDTWSGGLDFLMSCIALSVGLGNIWRFPFIALDNGGGAFIIPYLIVLFLVGRPMYYIEMVVGQFSGRNSIMVFDLSPLTRGIGAGQIFAVFIGSGYYTSLLGIIMHYFVSSFYPVLPWSHCIPEWGPTCVDSASDVERKVTHPSKSTTSAEFYFYREVLKEKETIHDGAGAPDLRLSLYLLLAWILISLIMIKGIKSSGKAAYFLAIFPYVILIILFIHAVWYAAITQVIFSLNICFGTIVMFASYNKFSHNIRRDATFVSILDTFTSLFAATAIFAILGNLAHENGSDDITSVVAGDTGLAFVSYPNALSKFQTIPQLFAILFFFMLFLLGIGGCVAIHTSVFTLIKDRFLHISSWKIVMSLSVVQFLIGLIYVTPGGQPLLRFMDYFGTSFVAYFLGIAQIITFGWIYGVNRLCFDIKFMSGIKTGFYWRICWSIITPALMLAVFIYNFVQYEPVTYKDNYYPNYVYAIGWVISAIGIMQLPLWAIYTVYKRKETTLLEKLQCALKPLPDWGPRDGKLNDDYQQLISTRMKHRTMLGKIKMNIFG